MIRLDLKLPKGTRPTSGRGEQPGGGTQAKGSAGDVVRDRRVQALVVAAVAAYLGMGFLERRQEASLLGLARERAQVEEVVRKHRESIGRAAELDAERKRLDAVLRAVQALDRNRYGWVQFMVQVPNALPHFSWVTDLTMLSYDPASGSVEFGVEGYAPSVEQASAFERELGRWVQAQHVQMRSAESVRIGSFPMVRFGVIGRVVPQADSVLMVGGDR